MSGSYIIVQTGETKMHIFEKLQMKSHITIDLSEMSEEYLNLVNISSIQASMLRWSQRENIIGGHHKKTKAFVAGTFIDKKNSQK